MAWTGFDDTTFQAGSLVDETKMNTYVRDNQTHLKTAIDNDGKLKALDSASVADLDGSNLENVPTLAGDNEWTGENDFDTGGTARVVFPVGADKWAT